MIEPAHGASVALAADATLPNIERARALLAAAKTVDEARDLLDRAAAMQLYLRRKDEAGEAYADAWEITQHACRRLGELCRERPLGKTGRPRRGSNRSIGKTAALEAEGIARATAYRWQRLANLEPADFAARIRLGRSRILARATAATIASPSWSAGYDRSSISVANRYQRELLTLLGEELLHASAESASWCAPAVLLEERGCCRLGERFIAEHEAGHFKHGVLLLARPVVDAQSFQHLARRLTLCIPARRVMAIAGDVAVQESCAMFYAGASSTRFVEIFKPLGVVLAPPGQGAVHA